MTDHQINKIVQSYVDELFVHDDMTDQESIEAKKDAFVMCMAFAGHILEKHCIVEKEVIKADYDHNALAAGQFAKGAGAKCAQIREWHQGKCDELISLFGKELFNEAEK